MKLIYNKAVLVLSRSYAKFIVKDKLAVHKVFAFSVVLFDAIATLILINLGLATEGAPPMSRLMEQFGLWMPLIVRQLVVLWVVSHPRIKLELLLAVSSIYSMVAILHVVLFLGHALN